MIQLYLMNTHFWSFLDLGPILGWVKNKQIVGRKDTFEILAQLKWRKNHIKGQQTFSAVCKLQPWSQGLHYWQFTSHLLNFIMNMTVYFTVNIKFYHQRLESLSLNIVLAITSTIERNSSQKLKKNWI